MRLLTELQSALVRAASKITEISILIAMMGLVLALASFWGSDRDLTFATDRPASAADERIGRMEAEVRRLRIQMDVIREAGGLPEGAELTVQVNNVERRLRSIETGIVETPEKALSVPLLRRDVTALSDTYKADQQSLRSDVERLYTIIIWLLGTVMAVAISVIGVVVAKRVNPAGKTE